MSPPPPINKLLGLIYYNYRHYHPADGRWIGEDPVGIEGGYNAYTFVKNAIYLNDYRGLFLVGSFINMAFDFALQVASNAANNKPLLDINYTSILISGLVGAVIPRVGSKFISAIVQSFRRSRKIGQMVPKLTKGYKRIYSKSDIIYTERLIENDRLMWSVFTYEAVTTTVYRQIGTKCSVEWCKYNNINDDSLRNSAIIITEKNTN